MNSTPKLRPSLRNLNPKPWASLLSPLAALLAGVASAYAHPGHDLADAGPVHLLTSPEHLVVLTALGLALWFLGRFIPRPRAGQFLQRAGVVVALAAAVLWGLCL